jgi:hypothetical protein
MTPLEIKSALPPIAIWMAQSAVIEGVKSHHKYQEQCHVEDKKKEKGETYNYLLAHAYNEGVGVSAEILWKMFSSCVAECKKAISEVSKHRDGYGYQETYFDDFVNALEKVQGHSAHIRISE